MWAKQDMVFIYNVLDTNEYSPQNNGKLFSEKMDLSFESRQDNLRNVLDKMQQIGIDAAELEVHQEYDLNVDKLKEQEEKKIEAGDIEQSEKKESCQLLMRHIIIIWTKRHRDSQFFLKEV